MKSFIVAAAILAATSSLALAQNITEKAMKDHPGHTSTQGTTANPVAKPNSGSLPDRAMQLQPGVNSDRVGRTATPTAQPDNSSLSGKVMHDTYAR